MKKIITILVLLFTFTLNVQAQKQEGKFTADKMLKKMIVDLNLTQIQQRKIKPLLEAQIADRKAMSKKRKAMKDAGDKPTKEMRLKMRRDRIEKETAMNTKMATILDKKQFAKFEAIAKEKKKSQKRKNS